MSKAEIDSLPTPWRRIRYRVHHGLKKYGEANEQIRKSYFERLHELGWRQGSALPIVHYAVNGRVADPRDAMDPEFRRTIAAHDNKRSVGTHETIKRHVKIGSDGSVRVTKKRS